MTQSSNSPLLPVISNLRVKRELLPPLTIAENPTSKIAVVIVPSAFGVADDLQEQMVELSREGATVISYDPFFGGDSGVTNYADMPRVMARLSSFDREKGYSDFCRVIDYATTQQHDSIIAVGICFGGPFPLRAAAEKRVHAAIVWHGTRLDEYLLNPDQITCPVHLHFGAIDPFVPPTVIEKVTKALASTPEVTTLVHPNATHGFTHRSVPAAYNERAEKSALSSVITLIHHFATL